MDKGIIYYTDNRLGDPIYSKVQEQLESTGLPIVSASLKPIDFGKNEVIEGRRGYATMVKQIVSCLERLDTKYVFFCEHDVLYHLSHFDFVPPRDDIFYYNSNNWRWMWGSKKVIKHDRMLSLSSLCVNRELALEHHKKRLELIQGKEWDKVEGREPRWARRMGYEPGTKKRKRGGFSNDDFDIWKSAYPNIDIRHKGTYSNPKTKLEDFKHKPKWWVEIETGKVEGWDLEVIFS